MTGLQIPAAHIFILGNWGENQNILRNCFPFFSQCRKSAACWPGSSEVTEDRKGTGNEWNSSRTWKAHIIPERSGYRFEVMRFPGSPCHCVNPSKGQKYSLWWNVPSCFTRTVMLPNESRENWKVCNFTIGGTLLAEVKENIINIITVTNKDFYTPSATKGTLPWVLTRGMPDNIATLHTPIHALLRDPTYNSSRGNWDMLEVFHPDENAELVSYPIRWWKCWCPKY